MVKTRQVGQWPSTTLDGDESLLSEETSLLREDSENSANDAWQLQETKKKTRDTIIGMICVAVGTAFICTEGSIVAIIGGSVLEILLVRFGLGLILSIVWWIFKKPANSTCWYGEEGDRLNIWIRGVLFFILMFGWYRGLELVPIGDAEAIIFLAPILIVFIARFVLKEQLSKLFPLTFLLTIIGIVFVCQPEFIFNGVGGSENISIIGLIFLLIMSLSWAITSILVRTAPNAHWLQIQIVTSFQGTFIWTPAVILLSEYVIKDAVLDGGQWISFDGGKTVGLVFLASFFGYTGLSLNVIGYQMGDATKVAWMEYFDLIFAYIFQWALFGNEPNIWEWVGLVCLLSTCAVHLVEEIIKHRN